MEAKSFEIFTASDRQRMFTPSNAKTSTTRRLLCGLSILGLFLGTMSQARCASIYWSDVDGGDVRRANLDRTGGKMYWTDFGDGDIRRANLSGTGMTILATGLAGPDHLALDIAGGKMYWTGRASGDIRRANLDGSGQEILLQNLNAPSGI